MSRKKMILAVAEYAKETLYDPLGIWGWEVIWKKSPPDDEACYAQVMPTDQRKQASVYLCSDFEKLEPVIIHGILIHELIHLLHRDQTDVIRLAGTEAGMARSAYDVLHECMRIQTELMVDHLESRFSELIPINKKLMKAIIEQGKKGKK